MKKTKQQFTVLVGLALLAASVVTIVQYSNQDILQAVTASTSDLELEERRGEERRGEERRGVLDEELDLNVSWNWGVGIGSNKPDRSRSQIGTIPPQQSKGTPDAQLLFLLDNNNASKPIPKKPQRKICFLHIGKCGGTSIERILFRKTCQQGRDKWKDPEKRAQCRTFNRTAINQGNRESELSLHTLHSTHMMLRWGPIQSFDSYFYSIRDPVERAISSFYFLHYDNSRQSAFARFKHPTKDLFYKHCFPTLEAFDRGLQPPPSEPPATFHSTNITWPSCQHLALTILLDAAEQKVGLKVNVHMMYGFQYYSARGGNHSGKDVFVVRMENLWEDMEHLDKALGGTGYFHHTHHNKNAQKKQLLQERFHWCCLLYKEHAIYQDLLLRALNLSNRQKQESLLSLYRKCGISTTNHNSTHLQVVSWEDWHDRDCPSWNNLPNKTWLHVKPLFKK